jgi:hypothetical protein
MSATVRAAVFTCITGGYDPLRPPCHIDPRIDYWCFSDRPLSVNGPWRGVPVDQLKFGAKDTNRFVKMHPHQLPELRDYDFTIYVDGTIEIIGPVYELVQDCASRTGEIFLYDHPVRDCIYDEAIACAGLGHDNVLTIAAQMRGYRRAGYPSHAGLTEAGVMVRRKSPLVDRLMEGWWEEYRRGAPRDQLSLGFVAWRQGMTLQSLGPSDPRFGQRYFQLHPHAEGVVQAAPTFRTLVNRALVKVVPSRLLFGHGATSRP